MNIIDVKTSKEAAAETKARRARFDELQAEPDNATWLASQPERNAIEIELRELSQLEARLVEQEKTARIAELEAEVVTCEQFVARQIEAADALSACVKQTVTSVVEQLRLLHAAIDEKHEAARDLAYLDRELAKLGRTPSKTRITPSVVTTIARIQREVWSTLLKLDVPRRMSDEIIELFTPKNLPEDLVWAGWRDRGAPIAHRDESPVGGRIGEGIIETEHAPTAGAWSGGQVRPAAGGTAVGVGSRGHAIIEETEAAR
jgi:hypothetical protein